MKSSALLEIFPRMYGLARKAGVFKWPGARSAYRWAYFAYKKYLEDPYDAFCRKNPDFFARGHILDVGANVGYTSWVFSQALSRVRSSSKVFAFEPESENFQALSRMASRRSCAGRLEPVRAAVGDQVGELELWINEGHNADHRILTQAYRENGAASGRTEKVPVVTLDAFCKDRRIERDIGFVKIDVQGYEPSVCRGMADLLDLNPALRVAIEVDPALIRTLGEDGNGLNRFFSERGFRFAWIRKDGSLIRIPSIGEDEIRQVVESEKGYLDVLCSRGEEIS